MLSTSPTATPLCAAVAREHGAALTGSAVQAEVWWLLEVTRPWAAKATQDNDLPPAAQAWIAAHDQGQERVQFIRQLGRPAGGIRLYLAVAREQDQRLYSLDLTRYAELPDVDTAGLLADEGRYAHYRCHDRLTLVCTNTRRDRCCGVFGAALYRQLRELGVDRVWQSSHLAGHRFAPVALWLPEGAQFGFLEPEECAAWLAARARQQLYLPRWRGRTFYPPAVQAADRFWRQQSGNLDLNALRLEGMAAIDNNTWRVDWRIPGDMVTSLTVRGRPENGVMVSCSPPKQQTELTWTLAVP